jgi:hypothetical protein
MSVFAIASDKLDVYELADELSLRGWHLDRQHFPPSLHMTVNFVHEKVADDFLKDLAKAAEAVRKPGLRKTASKFVVNSANFLTRVLPEAWVSNLMEKASSTLSGGEGLPTRMAPMYGLLGTLPNRGDLKELVLDLMDNINRYKAK